MMYTDKATIVILDRDITTAERGKVMDLLNGVVHTRKFPGKRGKKNKPAFMAAGVAK
jgi:hypothetical protein